MATHRYGVVRSRIGASQLVAGARKRFESARRALTKFIAGSRNVLDEVRRGAVVQIRAAVDAVSGYERERAELFEELDETNRRLVQHGGWSERLAPRAEEVAAAARASLGRLSPVVLRADSSASVTMIRRARLEFAILLDSRWCSRDPVGIQGL